MKKLLMMIGAAAVAVGATLPMAAMAEAKSVVLQATGYTGTATISGFQALVKLTEGAYGFSYNDSESTDGSDLWFEDSSGNLVPHDIDEWVEGGVSYVWVRIPSLTPRTTAIAAITMHWGEVRTEAQTCNASDTWSGFVGVWHMNETGTTAEQDSTANGIDAAPVNNSSASTSINTATGQVGAGRSVAQATMFKVTGHASVISDAKVFTVGGWVYRTAGGDYPRIFVGNVDSSRNKWELYGQSGTELRVRGCNDTELTGCAVNIGTSEGWHYLTAVYDGTAATLYDNGNIAKSGTIGNAAQGDFFTIGGWTGRSDRSFVGTFDEVRMYNGIAEADRVAADYATMTSPTTFLVAPSVAVSATWTGEGAVGDCTDPANWDCRNSSGGRIANAVPTFSTAVTLSGDNLNIQIPYGASFQCSSFTLGNCTLAADCDLRGAGTVTIPSGVTVDLKDRALFVQSLAGDGVITNTANGTYTTLDFIRADNSDGSQYIITDYTPRYSDTFLTKVNFQNQKKQCIYCARGESVSSGSYSCLTYSGDGDGRPLRFDHVAKMGDSGVVPVPALDTDYEFIVNGKTGVCKLNGANVYTMATSDDDTATAASALSFFVLNNNANGTALNAYAQANFKMYFFRIYGADGALIRDYVPAKNGNGVSGLWERVGNTFLPSAGGTAFIAGNETGRGELVFHVPSGETATRSGVTIAVGVKVTKEGAGTLAETKLGYDKTKAGDYCLREGAVSFGPSTSDYLDLGPTNFCVSGGTLTSSSSHLQIGRERNGCRFTQTGGTVSMSSCHVMVGIRASAEYDLTGGELNGVNFCCLGYGNNVVGTMRVSGGKMNAADFRIGIDNGRGSFFQSGGSCTVKGYPWIGMDANSVGLYEMTGGTLTVSSQPVSVGRYGTGTLNVSGSAVVTASNGIRVGFTNGTAGSGSGTLVVTNGGTIATSSIYGGGDTDAQATVTFGNATVKVTAAGEILKDLHDVTISAGGLTITNDFAVSITNTTLKVTPGMTAITVSGTGSLDLANATVVLDSVPSNKFTLVEATGDATLSGVPALVGPDGKSMGNVKAVLSDDGKTITVKSVGLTLTFY